jgi:hypothetical protein
VVLDFTISFGLATWCTWRYGAEPLTRSLLNRWTTEPALVFEKNAILARRRDSSICAWTWMPRFSDLLWLDDYTITHRFGGVHGTPESIDGKSRSEECRSARQLHDSVHPRASRD